MTLCACTARLLVSIEIKKVADMRTGVLIDCCSDRILRPLVLTCSETDPNYLTYYKRATAYLSLGRHAAALDDFDEILKINPSFSQVGRVPDGD